MAGERCTEMAGQQASTGTRAMFQSHPPALAGPDGLGTGKTVPLGRKDLQGVMEDVAAEQRPLAARFELDGDRPGRMPRRGLHLEMLVELRGAVDHLSEAG